MYTNCSQSTQNNHKHCCTSSLLHIITAAHHHCCTQSLLPIIIAAHHHCNMACLRGTDSILESYEQMRQDVMWVPIISAMPDGGWSDNSQDVDFFKSDLALLAKSSTRLLSVSTIRRLQACFSPLVCHQPLHADALARI